MFQIRASQAASLIRANEDRFLRRLADHLRATFPSRFATVADADLIDPLRGAAHQAYDRGFAEESEVAWFVEVVLAFGVDPTDPVPASILEAPDRVNLRRLRRLGDHALRTSAGTPAVPWSPPGGAE